MVIKQTKIKEQKERIISSKENNFDLKDDIQLRPKYIKDYI
jgi:hypothetical protein